ncbi:MAG TPA: hypothetical protein VGM51_02155 [Armatimonadota bacterium]|jgi:hypothetical protein
MKASGILTALLALTLLEASSAYAVPIVITYQNDPGVGFYDPVLGASRRACIEAAAANWANRLKGTVPVQVTASMVSMGGTATSAILGGAYAKWIFSDLPGKTPGVFYVVAEANQIVGYDLVTPANVPAGSTPDDINITYNSDVDNSTVLGNLSFYYGTDGRPGSNFDFYHTCFHELGHGLGFTSGFSQTTIGTYAYGLPLIYDTFLATGPAANAPLLTSLTDAQRAAAITSNALYFEGPNARAAAANTNPQIYAPATYQKGSSTAHLNEASYSGTTLHASINELMTPYLGPGVMHYPGPIVSGIFEDIGWSFQPYTMTEAKTALKDYAGMLTASEANVVRVHRYGLSTYPGRISLQDAVGVIRAAAGTETNPYILGTP